MCSKCSTHRTVSPTPITSFSSICSQYRVHCLPEIQSELRVLYLYSLCLASRPPDIPSALMFPKHTEHGPLPSCSSAVSPPLHYTRIHIPEARAVSTPSPFLNQTPSAKLWAEMGPQAGLRLIQYSRVGVATCGPWPASAPTHLELAEDVYTSVVCVLV